MNIKKVMGYFFNLIYQDGNIRNNHLMFACITASSK